ARVPSVHQPASGAPAQGGAITARRPRARRHRHADRAREQRGRVLGDRRGFHQYINLRPVRLLKGVRSPLAGRGPADIDMLIVRENNEGEYSEIGGRLYPDTPEELAVKQAIFTRRGCDRIMRYAFERAMHRPRRHVTSATKSNGIIHSMPYWDERFAAIAKEYPDV